MKHSLKITIILLSIFLVAQFVGIAVLYNYIDADKTSQTGKTVFKDTPLGERPPIEESTSFIWVMLVILLGTGFLLMLIKFKLSRLWKYWFLIAVILTLAVSFSAFILTWVAFVLAIILGTWKVFKPNFWVHNFTEIFVYGGLAALFVPWFNITSVSILLILIAIYDAYAVWKSKHMVTLAKSQMKAKVFSGLLIPYKLGKLTKAKKKIKSKGKKFTVKVRTAILGGGDIGFPLIFAGVVLKEMGLWQSLVIPFFSLAGLAFLLWRSEEKKFYPAMPFIGVGCFVGLAVVWLIGMI